MKVGIVGLGYVGLPLAVAFAEAGGEVVGLDSELGAEVAYHDPHIPELSELDLRSAELGPELARADLVCVITAHPEIDYERVVAEAPLVLDFRGTTRGIEASNLVRL